MAEAGVVCLIRGPPAITPDNNPRVSFEGGEEGRVAKASTSPPPYISASSHCRERMGHTILNPERKTFFPLALAISLSLFTNHSISGKAFAQPPVTLFAFFSNFTFLPSFFHWTTWGESAVSGSWDVFPWPLWSKAVMCSEEGGAARSRKK